MRINDCYSYPTFKNQNYLFVQNILTNKFDKKVLEIICQHAKGLFTPQKLLYEIMFKIRFEKQFIQYSLNELRQYHNNKNKKWDQLINNNTLSNNYKLYILYCTIQDIKTLNWEPAHQIYDDYKLTPKCPAKRYFNNKCSIIVINSQVVGITTKEFQIQLDHQLNHLFEQLNDKEEVQDINEQLQQQIKQYFLENNIISEEELNSEDFNIHMFNHIEFYQMISNLCNVISLYFQQKDILEIIKKLHYMLTEEYLKSKEFEQLEEPIRGSIIFAFICKKYNLERWKIVCSMIKKQIDLNDEDDSLMELNQSFKEMLQL